MTEKDKEIQDLRRELEYLRRSETVLYYLQTDARGNFIHDIHALDRGIRDLYKRCREAERKAQIYMAESVEYRRKCEALEMERKEEEDNRFPLFDHRAEWREDEDEHPEAAVSCGGL